ncbi:MAG TPA: HAD family hydrolase [Candidatus Binatia bacterium]|nr:HAD family hydrolase [Candidatus Binatia bacterium]
MRPTILLFDVDGTLVTTCGAGRRAIERAFAARGRPPDALRDVPFGGMTDRAIVRTGLRALGEPAEGPAAEAAIDAVLAGYLPILAEELAATPGIRLHAGVRDALDAAAARPGIALGLGTGNIRPGALLKLERVGVAERFAFGGFGSDHEDRAVLLGIGAARGASYLGCALAACRVVVIGDTPRDVAAAQAIGAESIVLATSGFTVAALEASGATHVFPDLAAPGALAAVLGP